MPTLSRADLRFCELADRWKDCYGIIEDCQRFALSRKEQSRYQLLADSLLDEIRRRRPDLDVRSLAEISKLDFRNPPSNGELALLVRDATDIIGETLHAKTTGRVGEYIALACPKLRVASPPLPLEDKTPPAAPASGIKTTEAPAELSGMSLTAGGKAIAAAYELLSEGKPVNIAAAAKRAAVNRSHVYAYPEAIQVIKELAAPNRRPPRGRKDRTTRNMEAWDDE